MSGPASHSGSSDSTSGGAGESASGSITGWRGHAIFTLDTKGVVSSWNEHATHITGYSAEEAIGRHCAVFYPTREAGTRSPDAELTAARQHGFYMAEGWRIRKNGSWFWANVAITARRSDDGSLHGFIAVIQDETESRARHQRSTRRFTDLFDLAPVGIGLFDTTDHVLHANKALCALLGFRLDELHGKPGADLLHPDDARNGDALSAGAPARQQRVLAHRSGRPVICDVHSAVSMEDSGSQFWQVVFQDVTEQRQHTARLHHRVTHDELTGLPNRAGVHEQLDILLAEHRPGQVAALFCDLDNFKRVNDSLGHEAGDELLVTLAQRLESELPAVCTAARLFGDEFLIVCSDLETVGGLDALTALVTGLLDAVVPVRDHSVRVSASIGAAVVDGAGTSSQDLVRFADAAMFAAKHRSPRGIAVASRDQINSATRSQVQIEGELRETIQRDGLSMRFHPIIDRDGSILIAEALMRWSHPTLGLVGPDLILSVAKQGNLLRELDRSVLRTALREAATWPTPNGRPARVAINLSGLPPGDPQFAGEIAEILRNVGIGWNRVVLEVLEESLSDLGHQGHEDMVRLVRGGVEFAVDDFGTAYSSLKRLKDIPVQLIKIDRGFVADAAEEPADFAIVRAVVDMSRGLGCRCIAEGVETTPQFRLLRGLGVDAFQGFLFSMPMHADEIRAILEAGSLPLPEG